MAFTTKLNLDNSKFEQQSGSTLNLNGELIINDDFGLRYESEPLITGDTQVVTKKYVDDSVIAASNVTGATNGLSVNGDAQVVLGGTLTGDTTIDSTGSFTLTFEGQDIEYAADYSASFTERSLVDSGYVTGLTSGIDADISFISGVTDTNTSDIAANDADIAFITGNTINTASNGLTKDGTDVKLGGTLTEDTTIDSGGFSLSVNDLSDAVISTSGASSLLEINAKTNGQAVIKSQSGSLSGDDFTNGIGFNLDFNGDAFTIIDNRATAKGIEYFTDYSSNYTDRSLVDKAYVDAIATGLDVKDSSNVATTGNIDLTGGTFGGSIDGISVVNGWRVLVKDQTDASQNGIYTYVSSASTFTRADDFDGNPAGEVTQGSFTFVITGDTNANTAWIVTTPDPITVGTTDIQFTVFSQPFDIVDGTGTTINIVGSNRQVSVELAPDSGLDFDAASASGRLRVASSFAGDGLTLTSGVLDVNASNVAISGSEVPVKFNGSDELVIDTDDLPSNDAANGLSVDGSGTVVLGGTLTGDTTIDSTGSFTLTFDGQDVEYAADYSASFTARSLVDAGYVTGLTSALEDDITFISGETDLKLAISDFNVYSGNTASDISFISGETAQNTADIATISGNTISDANNGLTKVGNTVVLGGELTGNTSISGSISEFSLTLGDTNTDILGQFTVNATGVTISGDDSQTFSITQDSIEFANFAGSGNGDFLVDISGDLTLLNRGSNDVLLQSSVSNTLETGVFIKILDSTTSGVTISTDLAGFEGAKYGADYSANFTERSLVDAGYVTGLTSNINVNQYTVTAVTSATLTDGDYVVLVQTSGSSQTITLPSSPVDGQAYKIKDRGNALTNSITIDGNGNNIDGAANATINTDYGALEIVYSETAGEWYTLAFIN